MQLIRSFRDCLPDKIVTMRIKGDPTISLPRDLALRYERFKMYLNDRHFMMTDYDHHNAFAHQLYDIEPNIICYNAETLKHQAFWWLKDPVHCQPTSKERKPYRYLKAIESAYDVKYDCDQHFARHIHRNPLYAWCDTDWRHNRQYSLAELAEPVDLNSHRASRSSITEILGDENSRNCAVFNELRFWAYPLALEAQKHGYEDWHRQVVTRSLAMNAFTDKQSMSRAEVLSIAKSVAAFTYFKYKPRSSGAEITDEFRAKQAVKGAIGGKKSKGGGRPSIDKKLVAEIHRLKNEHNYSVRKIAIELDISKTTASKYSQ